MKKILILLLTLTPILGFSQRPGSLYAGVVLHDFKQPGVSAVYNFHIIKNLSAGAGADVTSFEGKTLAPIYADVRVKIPLGKAEPYAIGQAGFPIFSKDANYGAGAPGLTANIKGSSLYAAGAGIAFRRPIIGFYFQYLQRFYTFKESGNNQVPDGIKPDMEMSPSIGILTAGIVF